MADHGIDSIRNVALAGHAGAGKTTLCEALLAASGATATPNDTAHVDTRSDAGASTKAEQHSSASSVLGMDWRGCRINLIDTPGYPDFLGQTFAVLPAVESVAVVVNAQTGIEPTTRAVMEWVAERGLCRMIVVNRIDADGVDLPALLTSLRDTFGAECLALNLPADQAATVVDCFFQPAGEADFSSVAETHETLIDQVVEVDEALMTLYLEQGETLSPEQLHDPFEAALRAGHLIPVCFTSARTGAGVGELLSVIERLMPNPLEGNPPAFVREDADSVAEYRPRLDPDAHVLAHVVKIEHDPYAGKLAVFRVHQGTITRDSRLYIGDARKAFKVNSLYRLLAGQRVEVAHCVPGDIGAVGRVDAIHFDAVLHDSHDEDHIRPRPVELPTPVFGRAVRAVRHGDEQKLSDVIAKLVDEDPGLSVDHDPATRETVLRGLGELHLTTTLEKMQRRFNVEVETSPPSIAYRETITVASEGHYRHKKQTGGAGQFGEVYLRVEPLARGEGFEFVDAIKGGTIPSSLVPAVEKGVRQAMAEGAVAGYPIQDVRVTVYDGKTHAVDSKEVAFVIAGRKAFLDAFSKAEAIVLEPLVTVQIDAPGANMGDITGDLAARRGHIQDTDSHGERIVIKALAPMAELDEYATKLNALTGGDASHRLAFSHYDPVPGNVQERLMAAYKPREEEA